jgi:hypothetical protein
MKTLFTIITLVLLPVTAAAQTAATVTTDAPIYITNASTQNLQPLRVAAVGTVLKVLSQDAGWVQIQFEDPQWGRRTGWVQLKHVSIRDTGLQPMDLSVRDAPPARAEPPSAERASTEEQADNDPTDTSLPRLDPAPPTLCRVFLTTEEPPRKYYIVVKREVQVGKKWYGSYDGLLSALAREAAVVNADAVVGVHSWRAPSMWSWAAAKTGGRAVRWTDEGRGAFSTLKGECFDPNQRSE